MSFIIKWVFKTVLGRWVTAGLVTLLLSGVAWKWHNFKEGLIHQGTQVCVQEINRQTVLDLQSALADEMSAHAELTAKLDAAAAVNQETRNRRRELETQVSALEKAMAEQARTDNEYKEWSAAPLPDGVAARLRNQRSGSDSDPGAEDSN